MQLVLECFMFWSSNSSEDAKDQHNKDEISEIKIQLESNGVEFPKEIIYFKKEAQENDRILQENKKDRELK